MRLPALKPLAPYLISALLWAVTLTSLSYISPLLGLEKRMLDTYFQVRGAEPAHPDILIVAVTDEDLRQIGSWPWPRKFHSTFLNVLRPYEPAVILFDMFFPETSDAANDEAFATAVQKSGNVVFPFYFTDKQTPEANTKDIWGLPFKSLASHAKGLGYVDTFTDPDGHVREVVLRQLFDGKLYSQSGLAAAAVKKDWKDQDLKVFVPGKPLLINFPGPFNQFSAIPYGRLIWNSQFSWFKPYLESLRGKVIIYGYTAVATGGMDLKVTSFDKLYPGIGIIASVLHTVLTGHYISRISFAAHALLLFFYALLVMGITTQKKPLSGILHNVAITLIAYGLFQLAFNHLRIWVPLITFLISGIALHAFLTISAFVRIHFEREILARELSLASRIQKNLLPTAMPDIPNAGIAAVTVPARHVGGDLYDLTALSEGRFGICIGDVSGKGVPAALFMAKTLSEFRREAAAHREPSAVVSHLNKKLAEGGFTGLFVTLLFLILDPANRRITFANGGHDPIFFYRKRTREVELLVTESGTPLGIDAETIFDQKEIFAEPGDILLLESDGIKESMNVRKEIFDVHRIQDALIEAADKSAEEILLHLKMRVDEFVRSAPQHDDLTLVCVKFL